MYSRLDRLYKKLFDAQEENDFNKEKEIRGEINREILSIKQSEDNLKKFLNLMSSKPFYRNLKKFVVDGNMNDIEVSKALSSMLTHSLIQMEKEGQDCYSYLRIYEQSCLLNRFIGGEISVKDVRTYCQQQFGKYL